MLQTPSKTNIKSLRYLGSNIMILTVCEKQLTRKEFSLPSQTRGRVKTTPPSDVTIGIIYFITVNEDGSFQAYFKSNVSEIETNGRTHLFVKRKYIKDVTWIKQGIELAPKMRYTENLMKTSAFYTNFQHAHFLGHPEV